MKKATKILVRPEILAMRLFHNSEILPLRPIVRNTADVSILLERISYASAQCSGRIGGGNKMYE
jgi:hypothetical protein